LNILLYSSGLMLLNFQALEIGIFIDEQMEEILAGGRSVIFFCMLKWGVAVF
jgi:hypothetical protein